MFNSHLFNDALFNEGARALVTVAAQANLLYIFNSSEELTAIIPASDYTDARHYEKLNGDNTFRFKIINPDYMPYLTVGSLVAFIDLDAYWQFFEIKQVTDTHKNTFEKQVYCQHCLYELIDDIVTDVRPSTTALAAITSVLANTRWNVGIVDDLGTASCNVYYESALAGVQKVAETWGGELRWRCLIMGGVITRYVDLMRQRGADTGKTFSYDKDIEEINREIDLTDVCTAMYGRGKGVETDSGSYGRRLTFKDEVWTVAGGDPADKPADQEWVGDTSALALYGRPGNRHRYGVYTNEEQEDAAALLQETWDYLQTVNSLRATYTLKAIVLEMLSGYSHEAVRLGDTVRVIDEAFTPKLRMSARVIELERDLLDPSSSSVTVGNFAPSIVEVTYNVQKEIRDVKNSTYNTAWLDGKISVLQNEIENTTSYVFQTKDDGILIMDAATFASATKAMKIGGGIFALANTKTGDTWNWRTFGTGAGFTADEITTGLLNAALIQVGTASTFEDGYDPATKTRTFTSQPTPPYDVGDIWTGGPTGDIKKCKTAKATGQSYAAGDWENAGKYTDDTVANTKCDQPGYVTVDSAGFSVYDADDNLRVLIGSWIRDLIRRYGIKIIDGEIYASEFRTGAENATDYIVLDKTNRLAIIYSNQKVFETLANSSQAHLKLYENGVLFGELAAYSSKLRLTTESGKGLYLRASGAELEAYGSSIYLSAPSGTTVNGDLLVQGSISKTGSLNYIEFTKNYGARLLNAVESPELLYYDKGTVDLINGEAIVHLDPIFLECIEPDTESTPWDVWVQSYGENDVRVIEVGPDYFKIRERNNGNSNSKVKWKFEATRKNYAGIRLQEYQQG
ncbi:MAG: phage tail protein [Syntrophomonas sp.]